MLFVSLRNCVYWSILWHFSAGLHEFDSLKNSEVNIFRSKMKFLSEEVVRERKNYTWIQKMKYQFPPTLIFVPVDQQIMSQHSPIPKKLRDGHFVVTIKFENNDVSS